MIPQYRDFSAWVGTTYAKRPPQSGYVQVAMWEVIPRMGHAISVQSANFLDCRFWSLGRDAVYYRVSVLMPMP